MDVNEWMSYECSDEGTCTQNIRNSSTRSHPSEEENRTRNRSKNCKCKQVSIDHLRNRLNFYLNKSRQKFHHSLKEHHKISNIPKSLRNVVKCGKYSLAKFAIFCHFVLQTGN